MTRTTFKTLATTLLAASILASAATAADLRLKSKNTGRMIAKPAAGVILKGNVPNLPDLIVKPMTNNTIGMPNTGVCGNWSSGYVNVKFRVQNAGAAASDIASFNLTMQKQGQYVGGGVLQVPALNPGQVTTITFPVPNAAQPGYSQSIKVSGRVDTPNYIPETNEGNNWHTGYCHGPTT